MSRNGVIVLVAGLAFAGFVFYSLSRTEPVKVSQTRLEQGSDGVDVAGRVENTASDEQAIDLEVHYYDANGRPLGQNTVAIDHLKGGESREFTSPKRRLSDVSSFSIYLNHGRNPYGN